jgi:uncharacterized protein (DUF1778 family)
MADVHTYLLEVDKYLHSLTIGNFEDMRMSEVKADDHETRIVQSEEAIKLTATSQSVSDLGDRVAEAEGELIVQSDAIAAKVDTTTFNTLGQRVTDTEGELIVQSGLISAKASQTDFDALGQRVTEAEADIVVQTGQIQSKVSQLDFNALSGTVGDHTTTLTQQAGQIALKASQSSVDSLGTRVTNAESELIVQAGQISSKVSANGVISAINQSPEEIALEARRITLTGETTVMGTFKVLDDNASNLTIFPKIILAGTSVTHGTLIFQYPFTIPEGKRWLVFMQPISTNSSGLIAHEVRKIWDYEQEFSIPGQSSLVINHNLFSGMINITFTMTAGDTPVKTAEDMNTITLYNSGIGECYGTVRVEVPLPDSIYIIPRDVSYELRQYQHITLADTNNVETDLYDPVIPAGTYNFMDLSMSRSALIGDGYSQSINFSFLILEVDATRVVQ